MGISETAMRVSLTRLVADGKIVRTERGLYIAAREAHALFRRVDQWERKHTLAIKWRSGDWLAVHSGALSKADKTVWRHHHLALALCGFAQLRPGLHVRPNNLRGGVRAQASRLRELGLAANAMVFRLCDMEVPNEQETRALWNVSELVAADQNYINALEKGMENLDALALDAAVKETMLLGRSVIAHLIRDPVLPTELMPSETRERLFSLAAEYQARARLLWEKWLLRS